MIRSMFPFGMSRLAGGRVPPLHLGLAPKRTIRPS